VVGSEEDTGQTLSYSLVAGNAGEEFDIDQDTAQIRVHRAVLNHEGTPAFTLTVQAMDDGGLAATCTVAVTVSDVNEAPILVDTSRSIEENSPVGTPVGAPVVGSDVDDGQTLTYSLESGHDGSGVFTVNASTGQISVLKATIDFEAVSSFALRLRATDDGSPALYTTAVITVSVIDVNEAPVMESASREVPETLEAGGLVGTALEAADEDSRDEITFAITGENCWGASTPASGTCSG
jgi:hypothetical protein